MYELEKIPMNSQFSPATSESKAESVGVPKSQRRSFDRKLGVAKAKELFHQYGYDALGIAELTAALDINPPSLYAAFGSKAGLFDRCLDLYAQEANLPAAKILMDGRPLSEAIQALILGLQSSMESLRRRGAAWSRKQCGQRIQKHEK